MISIALTPLTDKDDIKYGRFYGLLSNQQGCDRCDSDGMSAVVSINGEGLMLRVVHPSRVVIIEPTRNQIEHG